MKAIYVGAGGDRLGFALAGVEVVDCTDPSLAEATLERIAARTDIALLLVSELVAEHAPLALGVLRRRGPPPTLSILPESAP